MKHSLCLIKDSEVTEIPTEVMAVMEDTQEDLEAASVDRQPTQQLQLKALEVGLEDHSEVVSQDQQRTQQLDHKASALEDK